MGSQQNERNRILGVWYDNITMADALNRIGAPRLHDMPLKVAFINADCLNQAWRNQEYRAMLDSFDLVLPDGSGLAMAGKILHQLVRENVNGTDLLPLLCVRMAQEGRSLFLLGARPGVAQQMAERLQSQYPALNIVGVLDGFQPDAVALDRIHHAAPDVVLVAKGAPRQELFIGKYASQLPGVALLGVGGLFDFYSGNMPRAPRWLRKLGLEWTFRLAMEPRRMFKRYILGNPLFLYRVWRYGATGRRREV